MIWINWWLSWIFSIGFLFDTWGIPFDIGWVTESCFKPLVMNIITSLVQTGWYTDDSPIYFCYFPALLAVVLALALIAASFVVVPIIYRHTYKTSILHWSGFHPDLAAQTYCPICRKRSTSKFMRTICCQAQLYSVGNVSKMLPPMNAFDSHFGKWNETKIWPIKSESVLNWSSDFHQISASKWWFKTSNYLENKIKLYVVHQNG